MFVLYLDIETYSVHMNAYTFICNHPAASLVGLLFLQKLPYGFYFSGTYRKFPKYSDTQKICCNHFKIWTMWLYYRVMSPNDADRMANSVDPDQTPLGAVWSGSALFAQACLSENLGSLWYLYLLPHSMAVTCAITAM